MILRFTFAYRILNMDEEDILTNDIQKRQQVLDSGWKRDSGQRYIYGHPVSEEEYWRWMDEQRQVQAMHDAELSFYSRCTSTGEEWETDSDGDYTPDWLYDKI